ncbi:putative methylenetetrahydrofolate reductase [Trypoxylus dichotomus]
MSTIRYFSKNPSPVNRQLKKVRYKMKPHHLTLFFKAVEAGGKRLSLELCTNRKLNIQKIKEIYPPFCSVTWLDNKINNITKHPTIRLSQELLENDINVLIHLPGRIYDKIEMLEILTAIKNIGVKNILVVQGEKSLGESKDDFPYACNLLEFIRQKFNDYFCIGVTGYPLGHPRSGSLDEDLLHLKEKVIAGADFIITQAIFDVDTFRNFSMQCRDLGINVPILPGLFIINSYSSLMNMVKFCKLHLPDDVIKFVEEHKDDKEIVEEYGISSVVNILENLFRIDAIHCVHIFTLNDLDTLEKGEQTAHCFGSIGKFLRPVQNSLTGKRIREDASESIETSSD